MTGTASTNYTFTLDDLAQSEVQPVSLTASNRTYRSTAYSYDGQGRKTTASISTTSTPYSGTVSVLVVPLAVVST